MEEIYARFRGWVEFFVVYMQEAHPTDGWQTESNVEEGVLFRQHQSYDERQEVAQTCSLACTLLSRSSLRKWTTPLTRPTEPPRNACTSLALMGKWPIREAPALTSLTWTSGNTLLRPV
jgi:hypothetical protein